jgi:CAAX prenyl protease-like protein
MSTSTEPKSEVGRGFLRDEIEYILPMFVFLGFIWVGQQAKWLYAPAYVARGVITAALLIMFWKRYTPVRWKHAWLGVVIGVVGIVQWVGMQTLLERNFEYFKPDSDAFNPYNAFSNPTVMWAFILFRAATAVLVVPVMEELFWRDYLWRQIISPNDFKLAKVGEFEWPAFLIVPALFATVHGAWWPTAIVWALMIGWLLAYTKSLGACIIAHAVTNLLLAVYVLKYHAWHLW